MWDVSTVNYSIIYHFYWNTRQAVNASLLVYTVLSKLHNIWQIVYCYTSWTATVTFIISKWNIMEKWICFISLIPKMKLGYCMNSVQTAKYFTHLFILVVILMFYCEWKPTIQFLKNSIENIVGLFTGNTCRASWSLEWSLHWICYDIKPSRGLLILQ